MPKQCITSIVLCNKGPIYGQGLESGHADENSPNVFANALDNFDEGVSPRIIPSVTVMNRSEDEDTDIDTPTLIKIRPGKKEKVNLYRLLYALMVVL